MIKIFYKIKIFFVAIFFISNIAYALSPESRLSNVEQEQRAMMLFSEVKCLVCSGQSVESSNTEFSYEMRKLIRQKISEGKSDSEIRQELVKEFGDDVLLSSSEKSYILLIFTFIFVILLSVIFIRVFFR